MKFVKSISWILILFLCAVIIFLVPIFIDYKENDAPTEQTTKVVRVTKEKKNIKKKEVVNDTIDLKKFYNKVNSMEEYEFAIDMGIIECAIDNSYLKIDSDPYNNGGDGTLTEIMASDAISIVEFFCDEYNIPTSVVEQMKTTSAIDGSQEKNYDQISFIWRYHPDNGLEVLIEKNNIA